MHENELASVSTGSITPLGNGESRVSTLHAAADGLFTLVIIRNPFRTSDREIMRLPADGQTVSKLLPDDDWGAFRFSLNGRILTPEEADHIMPRAGDFLAACPVVAGGGGGGGKNPLTILATIALTVVSFGIGGMVAGAIGGMTGTMVGYLAAGAVMYLGGSLIGNMTAKAMIDRPALEESAWENGHSWGEMRPLTRQGTAVAITYGTVRVPGMLIGQHVSSDGNHQYLNLLLSGGEGPLDSITGVELNGNPATNFSGTSESLIDDVVNATLTTSGYATATTTATDAKALDVEITFPSGIRGSSWGSIAFIRYTVEYRKVGDSAWTAWVDDTVRGGWCTNLLPPKTFRKENLAAGRYEVRAKLITATGAITTTVWSRLSTSSTTGDVIVETRLGTNDQTAIGFFSDSYSDQFFQMQLSPDEFVTYQTEGDGGAGLEFTLTFPSGLYYVNDDGSPGYTWIDVTADYRRIGAASWTSWLNARRIQAAEQKPVRRTFRQDGLAPGQYEVRMKLAAQHGTTSRFVNACMWTQLTHIIYDDFIRPGKALVAIRAVATDKLSGGMPTISWLQTRSTVLVWNPGTAAYEAKAATNPAWACYDLIHRCKRLMNVQTGNYEYVTFGEPAARIDYTAFSNWAAYCDKLVEGTKRAKINLYIDSASQLWDALPKIAQAGRGIVVLKGTTYSAVWDEASAPVQMFTVGNILRDTFNGHYLATKDRANAIEVGFLNEAKDFQRDTIIVYGSTFDEDTTVSSPTQVFLPGVTDYRRAYREGLYRLRLNQYLKRMISFQAEIDAIGCQVGDVILIQHDIPRWGIGGRLTFVSPVGRQISLDKPVTMQPGTTYVVMIRRKNDEIIERTVVAVTKPTTTATITVTSPFIELPEKFDIYAFGEQNKAVKPFRVTRIGRAGNLRVRVEATEYYAKVYDETAVVPDIDYSMPLPTVRDLRLGFAFDLAGNGWLTMTWLPPRGSYGGAAIMVDGKAVGKVGATISEYRHHVTVDKTYAVAIIGLDALGKALGQTTGSYTVTALSIPDVTGLSLSEDSYVLTDGTVLTDVIAAFTLPAYRFFGHCNIYYELNGDGNWLKAGETSTATSFRLKALNGVRGQTIKMDVRVCNRWNVEGSPTISPALALVGKSAPPTTPTGFTAVQNEQNRAEILLSWTPITDVDASHYEVRRGASWDAGTVVQAKVKDAKVTFTAPASGDYTFWLKSFNNSQNPSATAATTTINATIEPATVAGLTASQDPANRTQLRISWTPSTEKDVKRYEVRLGGSSWATATVVGDKIADPYTTITLATEGPTTIRVKAINRAGFYSANDEMLIYDVNLTPSDVTGFQALQNGDNILLSWNKVTDQDILGYRIVEGPAYSLGALFAECDPSKSQVEVPVSSERDYKLLIKAINCAGYESANAASAVVTIMNLTPRNVVQSYDELVLQSGTHSGTEFGSSIYTMATLPGRMSDYPTLRMDVAGSANVLKLASGQTSGTYTCVQKDMGEIITAHIAVDWFVLALQGSGQAGRLEFRTSLNGTTWTDWLVFAPATQTFRYVAFRVVLATTDVSKTPEVTLFTISIDVPDTELIFRDHSIAAAGTELNFGHTYHVAPSVTVTSLGDNTHGVLVSKTTEKCTLKIRNFITGAYVDGTADIRVRGY